MTSESTEPLEELTREDDVAQELVERLAEYGLALLGGTDVPPGEIAEGIRLLEQYRIVHAHRIDADLQPEARAVALPSCFEHLDSIIHDHAEAGERMERARAALDAYARGEPEARARLAQEIGRITEKEYEQLHYEAEYPLSCLQATLPEEAAARVSRGFGSTAPAVADLEQHIRRYLGRNPTAAGTKLRIRCRYPGCNTASVAETCPSNQGHLGIRPPEGWRPVPRPARVRGNGPIVMEIDFYCPAHAPAPLSTAAPTAEAVPRGSSGAMSMRLEGPSEGTEERCPCCDPISETLA